MSLCAINDQKLAFFYHKNIWYIFLWINYILKINGAGRSSIQLGVFSSCMMTSYWPFVRGIPRSPVNSPHKDHQRGALIFSLICAWINGWTNNREAGDLRRHRAHYDVTVMWRFNGADRSSIHLGVLSSWSNPFSEQFMVIIETENGIPLSQIYILFRKGCRFQGRLSHTDDSVGLASVTRISYWSKPFSQQLMMTPSNGTIFRVTGPLCGEFTGHRRIPLTKTSEAELWCFLWSAQTSQ